MWPNCQQCQLFLECIQRVLCWGSFFPEFIKPGFIKINTIFLHIWSPLSPPLNWSRQERLKILSFFLNSLRNVLNNPVVNFVASVSNIVTPYRKYFSLFSQIPENLKFKFALLCYRHLEDCLSWSRAISLLLEFPDLNLQMLTSRQCWITSLHVLCPLAPTG